MSIKMTRVAVANTLAFLYAIANVLDSTQSCDCWVVKAVLRLRTAATSIPEYVSGWYGQGSVSHSQPFLLTYSRLIKAY